MRPLITLPDGVITRITMCVNAEKGIWRTACTCIACVHARCCQCGAEWWQRPDPLTCNHCGSLYVEWVNWEQFRKTHGC